jgi:hypothetical protein
MSDEDSSDTTKPSKANGSEFGLVAPVLSSERLEHFRGLHQALFREINPRGTVEQLYVYDIACDAWEILRLRRCKTAVLELYSGNPILAFTQVGPLDKMLLALEARRDKSLVFIGQYRASLAQQLRECASRIIDMQTTNVPVLKDAPAGAAPDSSLEMAPGGNVPVLKDAPAGVAPDSSLETAPGGGHDK